MMELDLVYFSSELDVELAENLNESSLLRGRGAALPAAPLYPSHS
jgi:hypothetical protein